MSEVRVIEIKENVFGQNDKMAIQTRELLKQNGTYLINVMSSPGSGKTTTLQSLINILKKDLQIGEMDVDIESNVDAKKVADATGIRSLQINNGGLCHIDADMTYRAIKEYGIEGLDLMFLENIGNLVCPAEFDTGANINMMILSVPEGDDKPLKYPLMFKVSDIVLINKIDTLPVFDFDVNKAKDRILALNPNAIILEISAKKGTGMQELANLISAKVSEFKSSIL